MPREPLYKEDLKAVMNRAKRTMKNAIFALEESIREIDETLNEDYEAEKTEQYIELEGIYIKKVPIKDVLKSKKKKSKARRK